MTYTAFGPVADLVADPAELAADITALLVELTALTGRALAEVASCSLGAELNTPADVLFDQLRVLSYVAGAPELPCCKGDDDDAVAAWAATVTRIASTGGTGPAAVAEAGAAGQARSLGMGGLR
jgi:hypothetical protein